MLMAMVRRPTRQSLYINIPVKHENSACSMQIFQRLIFIKDRESEDWIKWLMKYRDIETSIPLK
jgi:hypothetical protein